MNRLLESDKVAIRCTQAVAISVEKP